VFACSPLAKGDFSDWRHVVMNWDFSSEEAIYTRLRAHYPVAWGDTPPAGEPVGATSVLPTNSPGADRSGLRGDAVGLGKAPLFTRASGMVQ